MEDYSGTVVRVVVGLSADGDYKISTSSSSLEFKLDNFISNSKARIATKDSNLVSAIEQDGEVLRITVKYPFRYETTGFEYPRRIAIDIFKSNPSKAERLNIADFYSETGKLNSADKTYSDLHIDYHQDAQILYQWAVLLHKRGSARATEKLAMIPPDSPYYKKAQTLMVKLHGDEEPLPPPPAVTETPAQSTPEVPIALPEPPVTPKPAAVPQAKHVPAKSSGAFTGLIPILLLVGVLIAIAVVIFVLALRMKPPVKRESALTETSDLALDTKTLCRMVSKLLSDGWSMREISKELKISQKEVEQLVQMCHSGSHDEQ
jgi:hypothetical protein